MFALLPYILLFLSPESTWCGTHTLPFDGVRTAFTHIRKKERERERRFTKRAWSGKTFVNGMNNK